YEHFRFLRRIYLPCMIRKTGMYAIINRHNSEALPRAHCICLHPRARAAHATPRSNRSTVVSMKEFVRAAVTPNKAEPADGPVEVSPNQQLEALVHGVAAGEQAALAELHDATVAKLYGLAR